MASFELQDGKDEGSGWIDPTVVLEQLRVVVGPDWSDAGGRLEWNVEKLPKVRGDEHALLQVFLNLAQNSLRAAQQSPEPLLRVHGRVEDGNVMVSIMDSGPGIADPLKLFQPFRAGADGSGLGLYISRTIMRSIGGELTFVAAESGCRFDVKLAARAERTGSEAGQIPHEVNV
jgi:C4-dicarboxylate-specific signal transduction histidine kinase